tara:strand:- start:569 stop:1099 length:531 start_codon:yes stop_codon:yes gene_type:complete
MNNLPKPKSLEMLLRLNLNNIDNEIQSQLGGREVNLTTRKEKKESTKMNGTIITQSELDLLAKLEAKGVSIDTASIKNECEIVEKKERESHVDFCTDSEIKKSVNKTRKDVKSLKGFKYEKTTLTTKQMEKLGSNYKNVSKVRVSVDAYDINIKASYKFLDANGKEVKPAKEVKES